MVPEWPVPRAGRRVGTEEAAWCPGVEGCVETTGGTVVVAWSRGTRCSGRTALCAVCSLPRPGSDPPGVPCAPRRGGWPLVEAAAGAVAVGCKRREFACFTILCFADDVAASQRRRTCALLNVAAGVSSEELARHADEPGTQAEWCTAPLAARALEDDTGVPLGSTVVFATVVVVMAAVAVVVVVACRVSDAAGWRVGDGSGSEMPTCARPCAIARWMPAGKAPVAAAATPPPNTITVAVASATTLAECVPRTRRRATPDSPGWAVRTAAAISATRWS